MIPRDRSRRRTSLFRLVTILSLVLLAAAVVMPRVVRAQTDDNPYSTISPETGVARDIQWLYQFIFWGALIVFIGVQFAIAYTAMRYRRRAESDARPQQVHGNRTLEITWTILPAVILIAIFIPTVETMYDFEAKADDGEESGYVIEVYGKQWWWEVHYTKPDSVADVVTANDIYVPVGQPISFKLITNNVIHSFWVPRLTGKLDLIPGHTNELGFTVEKPGIYYGECAEFCGDSHAWMRFKVIALEQSAFDQWIAGWRAGPSSEAAGMTPDLAQAPASIGICLGCHQIAGVTKNPAGGELGSPQTGLAADRILGPNLGQFACRTSIAAGILPNDEEHLRMWLRDPGAVKEGNYMATQIKKGSLSEEQITEIVNYLKTLRPEGGCVPFQGFNADAVVTLAPPAAVAAGVNPFQ
jgi:cytochrome c oxidase subunit 2